MVAPKREKMRRSLTDGLRAVLDLLDRLFDAERSARDVARIDHLPGERLSAGPGVERTQHLRSRADGAWPEARTRPVNHAAVEWNAEDGYLRPSDAVHGRQPGE